MTHADLFVALVRCWFPYDDNDNSISQQQRQHAGNDGKIALTDRGWRSWLKRKCQRVASCGWHRRKNAAFLSLYDTVSFPQALFCFSTQIRTFFGHLLFCVWCSDKLQCNWIPCQYSSMTRKPARCDTGQYAEVILFLLPSWSCVGLNLELLFTILDYFWISARHA